MASLVKALKSRQFVGKRASRYEKQSPGPGSPAGSSKVNKTAPGSPCWNCGSMQYAKDCPFKKHQCRECKQYGHKDGYCSSAMKAKSPNRRYSAKKMTTKCVVVRNVKKRRRFVQALVNVRQVSLQLDTASDISIISEKTPRQPTSSSATVEAATASGKPLKLEFECTCEIFIKQQGRFYIMKQQLNLLELDLIDQFNFWSMPINRFCNQISSSATTISPLKKTFPTVFNDAPGLCTKAKANFTLKEGAQPMFRPKRPVTYAMYKTVDDELDRLENAGIITPVEHSDWAAPIVVVRKASGAIRICGDYSTGLNDALQPHQYPLPLPQDIFAKLANCKVFGQIDLSDAFLQVEVQEESREMLTINTHRGLYRYNRLPPGVKAAPGAFQQLVDTMLFGLKPYIRVPRRCSSGVGWTKKIINATFKPSSVESRITGLPSKQCSFSQRQIKYLGHLIDGQDLRPDPNKIEAIRSMPAPTDVSGVRSFLGAIKYYGKFVSGMRTLRYPLHELLKTGKQFIWSPECQEAFVNFKKILASDLLLTHYNPAFEIIVSADASSIGVGATLSHKFPDGSIKVVLHTSRSLTSAEQAYSQPDREGLAIIFAVTKFHKMFFGQSFTLQTDHASLLRIFGSKKGIPVYTANRLQRWALQLLIYDSKIVYVNTEKFGNADVSAN
ncbi:uncharacterized protein K02A2.6-like [Ochlerotatus camptorhynchus]|uniref:uncharacterized protein K02A2.6-like n=1 Tax=Ochlerotatus camptorhynchus TaxID=644619 RepID=UPI0031D2FEB7